jgi:hypothetical protein
MFALDLGWYIKSARPIKQEGLVKLEDLTATSRLVFGIAKTEAAFADRATGTLVLNRYI